MKILEPIEKEISGDDLDLILKDFKMDLRIQLKELFENKLDEIINDISDEVNFDGLIKLLYNKKI